MLDALIHRPEPTWLSRLLREPTRTLAATLYSSRQKSLGGLRAPENSVSVACVSDTHGSRVGVPDADILIHAGDLTQGGTPVEMQATLDWLQSLPYRHKVIIAGNHDHCLVPSYARKNDSVAQLNWGSLIYLDQSSTILAFPGGRKVRAYGSPLTRKHGNWSFQYEQGSDVFSGSVPEEVDVLLTHSPPHHHLDLDIGDPNLLKELWRIRPKLHVCGHIHAGNGKDILLFDTFQLLFEEILSGNGGILGVLLMCLILFLRAVFNHTLNENYTIVHNVAIVGGARDQIVRKPITFDI